MTTQRIQTALLATFNETSLVFWHDTDMEFAAVIHGLQLDGVTVLHLDETPVLRIKLLLEASPNQRWLIYSAKPKPEPSKDWLLDVRMRSKSFSADATSILLEDLGLTTISLRTHLKERAKFLRAKDRVERLKRLVLSTDSAEDLDRKMLAVISRADSPELFAILQRVYGAFVANDAADLSAQPKVWSDICSNDLGPVFWVLVRQQLGYSDANRTCVICSSAFW